MAPAAKLRLIKVVHTLIWLFYNVVIFYMLYASVTGKLDACLWISYGLVVLEGMVLLLFRFYCPLTILARRYSDSQQDNFDIYLPNWLARYNKQIYTSIVLLSLVFTFYHLLQLQS